MAIYVEDFYGNYYKKMENHYLKLSPSKPNEDRRYNNFIIKRNVNKRVVRELIHKQYAETRQRWTYLGEDYEANKCMKDYPDNWQWVKNNLPLHSDPNLPSYELRWNVFSYNGKLVYVDIFTQYFPRCFMLDLKGEYAGWTTFHWLKPVYNLSANKWI